MKEFDFILKFALKNTDQDPEIYVDKLYEAGCDDATIGIGKKGRIALDFCREGNNAKEVMVSAISDVMGVIPNAKLIEVSPDMLGLAEAAEIIGCSRQNIRQLMLSHPESSPIPSHESPKSSVYHLDDILNWLEKEQPTRKMDASLKLVAEANKEINTYNKIGFFDPCKGAFGSELSSKLVDNSPLELFTKNNSCVT